MKQDLTEFSENELSLLVFNDEYLYSQRNRHYFLSKLKEYFIYTDEQFEILKQDLLDDEEENENEKS